MAAWQGRHWVSTARQVAAFAVAAGIAIYYALRAGSYDIVERQGEAVVLWFVLGIGYAVGILPRARLPRGWLVPFGGFVALALWTALSLIWTDSSERTLAEVARVAHLGGIVLLAWSALTRETWRAATAGLAFGAVVVCGFAVASRLAPESFPANDVKRIFGTRRLSYPFYYWNAVGCWGAMTIALALAWSAHARTIAARAIFAAAVPLAAVTVYLTYSRAGIAGSAFAVACVLVLGRNRWMVLVHAFAGAAGTALVVLEIRDNDAIANAARDAVGAGAVLRMLIVAGVICVVAAVVTGVAGGERWRLPVRVVRPLLIAGVLLAAMAVIAFGRDDIREGWDQFRGASAVPTQGDNEGDPAARLTNLSGARYDHWRSAWHAFEEEPLRGVSAGNFEWWWNQEGGEQYVLDAHSLYLEHLAELGLPGLLLLLVALGGLLALGVSTWTRLRDGAEAGAAGGCLAAFLVFLLQASVDWMWESTAVAVIALGSGALAAGAIVPGGLRGRRVGLRVAIALLAVVALMVQLPGLVSTSRTRDSQASFRAGDYEQALLAATEAADAEPWAAAPLLQRALVEESLGRLDAAAADARRAVEREPDNWRHRLVIARIEAKRGNVQEALAQFRTGRRLRPASSLFDAPPE